MAHDDLYTYPCMRRVPYARWFSSRAAVEEKRCQLSHCTLSQVEEPSGGAAQAIANTSIQAESGAHTVVVPAGQQEARRPPPAREASCQLLRNRCGLLVHVVGNC